MRLLKNSQALYIDLQNKIMLDYYCFRELLSVSLTYIHKKRS